MVFLLIMTFTGIIAFLVSKRDNDLLDREKTNYYIPLGIFSIAALLSAMFSEYKTVSFYGFRERFEGFFVLIAYVVIMLIAMNINWREKEIKYFFMFLFASAGVITLLGTLQFLGLDYFRLEFVHKLVTPASLEALNGKLKVLFDDRAAYSTLYNPNYVGSYTAMLLPVVIIALVFLKKHTQRAIAAALLILTVLCWIGSNSRAGLAGGIISLIIILIMFRKKILQHKKYAAVSLALLIAAAFVFNLASNGYITTRITNMLTLDNKSDISENMAVISEGIKDIKDIRMYNEKVVIETDKGILQIVHEDKNLIFLDENDNVLNVRQEDNPEYEKIMSSSDEDSPVNENISAGTVYVEDERFKNIRLELIAHKASIEIYNREFRLYDFVITPQGLYSNSNIWMTYRNDREIESIGFEGKETLGSGRGYIWSRSLPLLKDTIFLGFGPDTFALYFPQYDYLGKLKTYETGAIFVDKAHNFYLQTALNTGVISLLALIAVFVMYFISSIRIYIKEEFNDILACAGLACFTAVCGYLAAAFFNDSVVSVAPIFWALLGMGTGINIILKREKTEKTIVESKE